MTKLLSCVAVTLFVLVSMVRPVIGAEVRHKWSPPDYTVPVKLPSCDAEDAVIIRSAKMLHLLSSNEYRTFCFAAGDYRSAGVQYINNRSGHAASPRVIRMLGSENVSPATFAQSPLADLPLLPPLYFKNSHYWIIDRVAFIDIDEPEDVFPLRFFASTEILMNGLRVEQNRLGIEFHHRSKNITLQNSLIGDMDVDPEMGNDAVCVAFEGRYTDRGKDKERVEIKNIRVVANEIYNCNDGVQLIWNEHDQHMADFSGALIAANDIYIDEQRLSDCSGRLDPSGDCACTENAIDIKAGSQSASAPVTVKHNIMRGWRKTDSKCNKQAQSWGTAISIHYRAAKNIEIEENIFWDVASGIALTNAASKVSIKGNLLHTVPKVGGGNGIGLISYEGVSSVDIESNAIIDAHVWLSLLSEDTSLSCNTVANSGVAMGRLGSSSHAESNRYYRHKTALFKSASDEQPGAEKAQQVELCMELSPLRSVYSMCLEQPVFPSSDTMRCGK